MKKPIYFVLGALLVLIFATLYFSGKGHVQAVENVNVLEKNTDSLKTTVNTLDNQNKSFSQKVKDLDSIITVKQDVIERRERNLRLLKSYNDSLKKEANTLRKMGPIVIHDTVYITEKKNFWGRTKKTVKGTRTTDTLEQEVLLDSANNQRDK